MVLNKKDLKKLKDELDNCNKPLFFFDDDPDGTSAFLLLYRYKREGRGIPVKAAPKVDNRFLKKVEEYGPDKIFILDIPMVEDSFLENVKTPVVWLDHHGPASPEGITYLNPRLANQDDNSSTTVNCYCAIQDPKDLWIAMIGGVGDWQIPPFAKEFSKQYPDLLDPKIDKPEKALFASELGRLVKIISFMLKGKTGDVLKCIKVMTRVESPYEILKEETTQGRFIMKHAKSLQGRYDELLKNAKKKKTKDLILQYIYKDDKTSMTKELSNELLYLYPEKIILVGREKSGEVKMSLRSSKILLPPILQAALIGVEGYGGGHEHACGACVKSDDFKRFVEQLQEGLEQAQ
jgi:hypothetical protein